MTIAFGVACEDGVLLATDSLSQLHQPNGWIDVSFGRKVGVLGDHMAYVVSGTRPEEWAPKASTGSLADQVSDMVAELALFQDRGPQHVLVGMRSADGACRLALGGTNLELQEARPGGPPLIGGAMLGWVVDSRARLAAPPRRLAEAVPYAIDCCRRCILETWREWGFERFEDFHAGEPGGHVPPFAPPFHLAMVTATDLRTLEVLE